MRRMLSPITKRGIQLSVTEPLMANRPVATSYLATRRLAMSRLSTRQSCGPVVLVMQAWNQARW
jgi:hypothetical protein